MILAGYLLLPHGIEHGGVSSAYDNADHGHRRRETMKRHLIMILSLTASACAYEEAPSVLPSDFADSPESVRMAGKADEVTSESAVQQAEPALDDDAALEPLDEDHDMVLEGEDMCATFGLYDDEHCDSYCPRVDPVCDPSVYLEPVEPEPLDCSLESIVCGDSEVLIDTDSNGCGDTCVEALVGCASNEDCAEGDYCARPMGDCGASVGTCEPRPTCEIDKDTWKPSFVCGCDGSTFGMACDAAYVGINVKHEGWCDYPQD